MATYHLRIKNDSRPSGKKISAKRHVDYILREDGKAHADYINRQGAHSDCNDCIFKGNQLPKWAKGSAQKFFEAANRYEDKGNRRYKEIELSLPNELSLEQNRLIVERFISNHLANHYYAYAIHQKAGELSGEQHPHVHIMFSERLIDDVERTNERPACKFFRRAAKPLKGEKIASFERRREHGAPKDKKWHDKKFLYELREDFARIQNEVLAANGFSIRVDHRSLKAQQLEAQEISDTFLVQLHQRTPESYIGIISAHKDDRLSSNVKENRKVAKRQQTSLFLDDLNRKMTLELETKELVRRAELECLDFMRSDAYRSTNFDEQDLRDLNDSINLGLNKIRQLKRNLLSIAKAKEQAQSEYLTATERKLLLDYKSHLGQKLNLQKLLTELENTPSKSPENQQASFQIQQGIQNKIADLQNFLIEESPQFEAIQKKLQNPYRRKNVELATHSILQVNLKTLTELKNTCNQLLKNLAAISEQIEMQEAPQTVFTLPEITTNLFEHYRALKHQYEESVDRRNLLRLKKLSLSTILAHAKNIFAYDAFKRLHTKRESYEKAKSQYEQNLATTRKRDLTFSSTNWTNLGDKLQEQYYIAKSKFHLEATRQKLSETKIRLDSELDHLEALCQTQDAQDKIALIAATIFRRNLKIAHQYDEVKKQGAELSQKIKAIKKRLNFLKQNFFSKKQNHLYRVILPENTSTYSATLEKNYLTVLIADALLGEPHAVQLVARSSGNNLEMEKDWELMSDLDKDEIIDKKILREL